MPNTRSDNAGRIRTSISIGFYDLSHLQGWWGKITKLYGLSHITHVGLILNFQNRLTITLHPNSGAKLHAEKCFDKCRIAEIYCGEYDVDLDLLVEYCKCYADTSVLDAIFYAFIGRFIGLTRPRNCTTLVCTLLGLSEAWHPATLYRKVSK